MTDGAETNGSGRRGIRFDPTFNVGQVGQIVALVFMVGALWATFDARIAQNKDEIKRVETTSKETIIRAELELSRRITEQQSAMNKSEMNTSEGLREIKLLMRDGLKEIKDALDRKVDKPGR